MASYSTYNILKAAADGLADAINYRTNLKRKRREEEYNYNRDWERNEKEYQRKLQRGRDEAQWERNRQMEWLKNNPPESVDVNNPIPPVKYTTEAEIYGVPIALKYNDKNKFNDEMAKLKQQHDYEVEEINLANQGKIDAARIRAAGRGSGRQPRNYNQEFEDWLAFMNLPKTPGNYALWKRGTLPSSEAVKGGSGAVKERDPFTLGNTYMEKIYRILDEARDVLPADKVDAITKRIEIENQPEEKMSKKQKADLLAAMDKKIELLDASSQALLKEYEQRVRDVWMQGDNHVRWATDGKYGLHAVSYRTIRPDEVTIADSKAARDSANEDNTYADDLINKAKRVPGVGQNAYPQQASGTTILYSENPQTVPAVASASEQIPPSVKPFGDVPASATQQLDQNIIDLVQNYRNSIEIQRKAGVMGPKMYRQTISMLDNMMTAYARGEITADVIERTLRPSVYKKNLMTGARSYDY